VGWVKALLRCLHHGLFTTRNVTSKKEILSTAVYRNQLTSGTQ